MKKILVGFVEDGIHSGIEKYLLGVLGIAEERGVQMDFLTSRYDENMARDLKSQGCRLFAVPSLKNPAGQYRAVRRILRDGGYDKIYLNLSEPLNCAAAFAARREKVPEILLHSHSSGVDRANPAARFVRRGINALCRPLLWRSGTQLLSCSDVAAAWLFPKRIAASGMVEMIENAVDFPRFSYSEQARVTLRTEMELENKKVFLFIGHFCYAKNNFFLLEAFAEILKKEPEAVLLLAGTGADLEPCRAWAKEHLPADSARFLGVRRDIPALLSASDVFLLPSLYEGLPLVAVEAQASGLPCLLSDRITRSARISDGCFFLPLKNQAEWADKALDLSVLPRKAAEILPETRRKFNLSEQKNKICERILL